MNGYDSIEMINLYPLRSTDPKLLPPVKERSIYDKDIKIIKSLMLSRKDKNILVATGSDVKTRTYLVEALKEIIEFGNENNIKWFCIGTNKKGIQDIRVEETIEI